MRWMRLKPIIHSEVSQKDKHHILTHIYGIWKDGTNNPTCRAAKEVRANRLWDSVGEGEGMEGGGVQDEGRTHVYRWPIHIDVWQNHHNIVK